MRRLLLQKEIFSQTLSPLILPWVRVNHFHCRRRANNVWMESGLSHDCIWMRIRNCSFFSFPPFCWCRIVNRLHWRRGGDQVWIEWGFQEGTRKSNGYDFQAGRICQTSAHSSIYILLHPLINLVKVRSAQSLIHLVKVRSLLNLPQGKSLLTP